MRHRPNETPSLLTDFPMAPFGLDLIRLRTHNRMDILQKANLITYDYRLGILYPRGATLGGSSQLNAMNFAIPPDRDWDYIAELTGDEFWRANHMRDLFIDIENCTYAPEGTPGHGSGGFVQVRHRLIIRIFAIGKVRATGMTSLTLPVDQL